MSKKSYWAIGLAVLSVCSALVAYPHRRHLFGSYRVPAAMRHRQDVSARLAPYTIVQKEMTGYTDQDTKTTTITLARRSDGSEAEIQVFENRVNKLTGQNVTFTRGTLKLWPAGQRVMFRSDTNTKQTFAWDPASDSWKQKETMAADPSQSCLNSYSGHPLSNVPVQTSTEYVMGYPTIKEVQDAPLGHLTFWRLPEAACTIIEQKMEFKSGGTDVKMPVSITIDQEPDPSLFDVSTYRETDPVEEKKAVDLVWTGKPTSDGELKSASLQMLEGAYLKRGARRANH